MSSNRIRVAYYSRKYDEVDRGRWRHRLCEKKQERGKRAGVHARLNASQKRPAVPTTVLYLLIYQKEEAKTVDL